MSHFELIFQFNFAKKNAWLGTNFVREHFWYLWNIFCSIRNKFCSQMFFAIFVPFSTHAFTPTRRRRRTKIKLLLGPLSRTRGQIPFPQYFLSFSFNLSSLYRAHNDTHCNLERLEASTEKQYQTAAQVYFSWKTAVCSMASGSQKSKCWTVSKILPSPVSNYKQFLRFRKHGKNIELSFEIHWCWFPPIILEFHKD